MLEAGSAPANDAQERTAENVKALPRLLDQKARKSVSRWRRPSPCAPSLKKAKYFTSKSVSNFSLTTQVLVAESWTPELLEQRQRDLVAELSEAWDLTSELPVDA